MTIEPAAHAVEVRKRINEATRNGGRSLSLAGLGLDAVPDLVASLTALRELDLSGNALTQLPDWIGTLTALRSLDLRDNRLIALPDSIGGLAALTRLDLSRNQLIELPPQVAALRLHHIDLAGNPHLIFPAPEVVARGSDAVLASLRGVEPAPRPTPSALASPVEVPPAVHDSAAGVAGRRQYRTARSGGTQDVKPMGSPSPLTMLLQPSELEAARTAVEAWRTERPGDVDRDSFPDGGTAAQNASEAGAARAAEPNAAGKGTLDTALAGLSAPDQPDNVRRDIVSEMVPLPHSEAKGTDPEVVTGGSARGPRRPDRHTRKAGHTGRVVMATAAVVLIAVAAAIAIDSGGAPEKYTSAGAGRAARAGGVNSPAVTRQAGPTGVPPLIGLPYSGAPAALSPAPSLSPSSGLLPPAGSGRAARTTRTGISTHAVAPPSTRRSTPSTSAPPASVTAEVSGTVTCESGKPVKGVWVQAAAGSRYANWEVPAGGNGSFAKYWTITDVTLPYSVHVGCGGSTESWATANYSSTVDGTVNDFACDDIAGSAGYETCVVE